LTGGIALTTVYALTCCTVIRMNIQRVDLFATNAITTFYHMAVLSFVVGGLSVIEMKESD